MMLKRKENMIYYIETINDNGSGMKYKSKKDLLKELSRMIDDCLENGGTYMDFQVDSDASCFYMDSEDD